MTGMGTLISVVPMPPVDEAVKQPFSLRGRWVLPISGRCRAVSADMPLQHCVDFRGSTCGVVNRDGAPQWVCSSCRGFRLFSLPGKVYAELSERMSKAIFILVMEQFTSSSP